MSLESRGVMRELGAFSSYDTAPAPVFKGLPSLLRGHAAQNKRVNRKDHNQLRRVPLGHLGTRD